MKTNKSTAGFRFNIMTSSVLMIGVCFLVIVCVIFTGLFNSIMDTAKAEFLEKGQKYAYAFHKKISDAVNYLSVMTNALESQVNNDSGDRELLRETCFNIFDNYNLIDGTSIMFERNMYDGKDDEYIGSAYGTTASGKICYYFYKENGTTAYLPQAAENDIEFEEPYYTNARDLGKPVYSDPFVYNVEGRNIHMFTITYPMYDKNNIFLGAVTVDLFLEDLYAQLQSEKIYDTGYIVVTNDKNQVIYSPLYDDIGKKHEETNLDYDLPLMFEAFISSNTNSLINGKRSYALTVSVYIQELSSYFYISVIAPTNEIYAGGVQLMLFLLLFSWVVLLIVLLFLIRNIITPIKDITKTANAVADGHLDSLSMEITSADNVNSKNEIHILSLALKRTISQLYEAQRIKLLSLELQHEKVKAEEASQAKSAFLAKMSHEIRTPMNAIVGMAELILRDDISPDLYEHALSIKMAGANLLAIINDILDFSKVESGKLEITTAEYQMASLMNDVISIIRMRVTEKPILFVANIDCNIPAYMIGDEIRIRQILLNLLSNAYKYCDKGYIAFTIDGEITEEDTVILTIDISDSGIGIKEEDIGKLFGDFVQIDMAKNKGIEGTGLGLAITKNLCNAMGGDISVYSVYGEGTTLTVTLPQKFNKYEKFAAVENPEDKNVLVYETRAIYSNSIICSIDNLGVNCTLVTNQSKFYEEIENSRYSYIFVSSFLFSSTKRLLSKLDIRAKLVILTEFGETINIKNVRTLVMPAHSITIANILNDVADSVNYNESAERSVRFIAPTAAVLVVDDITTNLKVAQGLMLPYQMNIDICKSGKSAIELIKANKYDIVFMDHMMPEMDGVEATAIIRGLEGDYYKKLPIIALTANAVTGVKEMFLQNDFNDFLAKPIDTLKLNEILDRWIPREKHEKYVEKEKGSEQAPIEIEGIDVAMGISMIGGSIDNYFATLEVFYSDGLEKLRELKTCLENDDVNKYTVYVHALKSASASIGAKQLSEFAKSLEYAGNNEDIEFIRSNNDEFMEDLSKLLGNISEIISVDRQSTDKTLQKGDNDYLSKETAKLAEAIDGMDIETIDRILKDLQSRSWNAEISEALDSISKNILIFEFDEALAQIETINKNK